MIISGFKGYLKKVQIQEQQLSQKNNREILSDVFYQILNQTLLDLKKIQPESKMDFIVS
jgi:hypothetical protein